MVEEILHSKEDVIDEKYKVKSDKMDLPGDDDVRSKKRKGRGQGRVVMKEMGLALGFLNVSPYGAGWMPITVWWKYHAGTGGV